MGLLMIGLGCLVGFFVVPRVWWYLVHRATDSVPDPALRIGRLRRYVDPDGYSGYRAPPETRNGRSD